MNLRFLHGCEKRRIAKNAGTSTILVRHEDRWMRMAHNHKHTECQAEGRVSHLEVTSQSAASIHSFAVRKPHRLHCGTVSVSSTLMQSERLRTWRVKYRPYRRENPEDRLADHQDHQRTRQRLVLLRYRVYPEWWGLATFCRDGRRSPHFSVMNI